MKTIKAVYFVSLICVSSIVNMTGSVGLGIDSSTIRTLMDKNINYKERNAWVESESSIRSNTEHAKPKEAIERRQIRHSHLHRDDQSLRRSLKQDEKVMKNSEASDLIKINNNSRATLHQKLSETESKSNDRYTTQKTIINVNDYTEGPRRAMSKINYKDKLFTDYEDDDDFYDEYDDGDDGFYDDDKEEMEKYTHHNSESKYSNGEVIHHSMQYKIPETDTEPDLFNDDPVQDDYDEWVDSPQSDASDGPAAVTLKWERVPVGHNRGNKKVKKADTRAALQHVMMMASVGSCKNPQPRVVTIHSVHPNPSKQYTPHCTILHRCGEDTGCCLSDIAACSAKTIQTVHLYFYTKTVGHDSLQVEKLAFENHTECECMEKRSEMMVKDDIAFISMKPSTSSWKETTEYMETETLPTVIKRCYCPTEYSVHMLDNGDCECDCFNKQRDCMRIKRGKEYFGLKDRICIQNGHCKTPNCEFGIYNSRAGRCPKKHEQTEDITKSSSLFGK